MIPKLLLCAFAPTLFAADLMPLPSKMIPGEGKLRIDSTFGIAATGYSDARLKASALGFVRQISMQTGIPIANGNSTKTLTIDCREGGPAYPELGEDEAYRLDVTESGANLQSATVTGSIRGLATLSQLIGTGSEVSAVHIEDRPRFPWRGLMLDVSRHWMPVNVVERNLNAMAAVKLNVFHWHLSDDQGFRVESKRFPKLQQLGSDGNFYTQDEIRHVINYARDRGIRVVPEFDVPGHATSWLVAYPEFASAPGPYSIERHWGIFKPALDPTREETYAFLDELFGEMAALFPDRFFHIGGDEVDATQWKNSASIQEFARQHHLADSQALHAYFNGRVQALLTKYGKTMVGWDEIFGGDLERGAVIQSWRGQASLAEAARKGYRGILSFGYYLDHLKPASNHYAVDPLETISAEASRILGGEACMWSEYVSEETVDSRIWPRTAAIAERLWSPRDVTNVDSMYARLESVSRLLDRSGVKHRANYEPMLERLAAGKSSEPLRVLADASEALGIEARQKGGKYTSQVPLNRFVDAVRPESESVRHLERDVRMLVANEENGAAEMAELRAKFSEWAENDARLQPLGELAQLSKNLSQLGSIGLRALELLRSGRPARPAPDGWVVDQILVIEKMQKPEAEVTLAAVRPVRLLLEALVQRTVNK
jgi:hexosaminidase